MSSEKRTLKASFMNLPKPENNFELLVPDEEEAEGVDAGGEECGEVDGHAEVV